MHRHRRKGVDDLLHSVSLYPLLQTRHGDEPVWSGAPELRQAVIIVEVKAKRAGLLEGEFFRNSDVYLFSYPPRRSWPSSVPVGRRGGSSWPRASRRLAVHVVRTGVTVALAASWRSLQRVQHHAPTTGVQQKGKCTEGYATCSNPLLLFRPESSCKPPSTPLLVPPSHCRRSNRQLWDSRAACTDCTPAPIVAQRLAYRHPRTAPAPWNFWASCTVCTVGTRLCCTTGMVRHAENKLNLRHLQFKLLDCWNLSLKSRGRPPQESPRSSAQFAPREFQSRKNNVHRPVDEQEDRHGETPVTVADRDVHHVIDGELDCTARTAASRSSPGSSSSSSDSPTGAI